MSEWLRIILFLQAAYYLLTAVWPIVHMRSFVAVTGPKTDLWLVRTVGILILLIACTLFLGASQAVISPETILLSLGSAICLAGVDVYYVMRAVIRPMYLLDATTEIGIAILLAVLTLASNVAQGV